MNGECYYCHGLVLPGESDHIVLSDHGDHEVFMHRRCGAGHDDVEELATPSGGTEITCPECGEVEVRPAGN